MDSGNLEGPWRRVDRRERVSRQWLEPSATPRYFEAFERAIDFRSHTTGRTCDVGTCAFVSHPAE